MALTAGRGRGKSAALGLAMAAAVAFGWVGVEGFKGFLGVLKGF